MNKLGIKLAWALAAAFYAAAVIGFIPNPIVGEGSLFEANTAHNVLHLLVAVGFTVVAPLGNTASIRFMLASGVVGILIGVWGFVALGGASEGHLLGLVHINYLDNFLHLGLGAAVTAAGVISLLEPKGAWPRARTVGAVGILSFLFLTALWPPIPGEGLAKEEDAKRVTPNWFTVDAENRKVGLYIVAGLNTSNSGWNFNGYANGDMTIVVPLDWTVEIRFTSRDGRAPHSVGVIEIEDEIPVSGEQAEVAFPRAFSLPFSRGFSGSEEDTFDFKVNRTGRFWLFCGVPVHAKGGMWAYFVVSDEISEPYVDVVDKS